MELVAASSKWLRQSCKSKLQRRQPEIFRTQIDHQLPVTVHGKNVAVSETHISRTRPTTLAFSTPAFNTNIQIISCPIDADNWLINPYTHFFFLLYFWIYTFFFSIFCSLSGVKLATFHIPIQCLTIWAKPQGPCKHKIQKSLSSTWVGIPVYSQARRVSPLQNQPEQSKDKGDELLFDPSS